MHLDSGFEDLDLRFSLSHNFSILREMGVITKFRTGGFENKLILDHFIIIIVTIKTRISFHVN